MTVYRFNKIFKVFCTSASLDEVSDLMKVSDAKFAGRAQALCYAWINGFSEY